MQKSCRNWLDVYPAFVRTYGFIVEKAFDCQIRLKISFQMITSSAILVARRVHSCIYNCNFLAIKISFFSMTFWTFFDKQTLIRLFLALILVTKYHLAIDRMGTTEHIRSVIHEFTLSTIHWISHRTINSRRLNKWSSPKNRSLTLTLKLFYILNTVKFCPIEVNIHE